MSPSKKIQWENKAKFFSLLNFTTLCLHNIFKWRRLNVIVSSANHSNNKQRIYNSIHSQLYTRSAVESAEAYPFANEPTSSLPLRPSVQKSYVKNLLTQVTSKFQVWNLPVSSVQAGRETGEKGDHCSGWVQPGRGRPKVRDLRTQAKLPMWITYRVTFFIRIFSTIKFYSRCMSKKFYENYTKGFAGLNFRVLY